MPTGLPRLAAITVVRNEASMLPRWIAHYARTCGGPEHLTVVDNQSTDGSTADLPCRVVAMPDAGEFERARMALVSRLARELLEDYDAVVFTDADEFLVADPAHHAGLAELLAARPDAQAVGGVAFNLVQTRDEPDLDPGRPLLDQRRFGVFIPKLCKPAVKRVPAAWVRASHGLRAPYRVDPELWMFHAKFADRAHLAAVGDERHRLAAELGRGPDTTWRHTGHSLLGILDEVTHGLDLAAVQPFDPRNTRIGTLVRHVDDERGSRWLTLGDYQEGAMRSRPVRSVPPRFAGTV